MSNSHEGHTAKPAGESLFIAHAVIWAILAVAAYFTAGPFALASCWPIVLIYVPPVAILLVVIAGFTAITLLLSVFRPSVRPTWYFSAAAHGLVLVSGLFFCALASHVAVGQVSCL